MDFGASHICFQNKLSSEVNFVKKLSSWNGFPRPAFKSIIHQLLNTTDKSTDNVESPEVCFNIAIKDFRYSSLFYVKFDLIASKLVPLIRFKAQHDVDEIEFYYNTKDKTAVLLKSFIVYDFSFPGCGANYIGKIERTLYERTVEHA